MAAKIITASIPCPICDGRLRGNYLGYRCSGCKSAFTRKHVAWLSKHHLRTIIDKNFTAKVIDENIDADKAAEDSKSEEHDKAIISYNPQDKKIAVIITEAHSAAKGSRKHLEEMLDVQQETKDKIDNTKKELLAKKKELEDRILSMQKKQAKKNIIKKKTETINKRIIKKTILKKKVVKNKIIKKSTTRNATKNKSRIIPNKERLTNSLKKKTTIKKPVKHKKKAKRKR